jgi:hypothetical protein
MVTTAEADRPQLDKRAVLPQDKRGEVQIRDFPKWGSAGQILSVMAALLAIFGGGYKVGFDLANSRMYVLEERMALLNDRFEIALVDLADAQAEIDLHRAEIDRLRQEVGEPAEPEPPPDRPEVPPVGCEPGQVDVNRAGFEDLQQIIHIGPVMADRIVEARPFASLADLEAVEQIGAMRLDDIVRQGLACVGE